MRYLGLAVLILSILGSQVGIAVIVAEWRGGHTETIIERSTEVAVPPRPSQAELNVRKCEAILEAAGNALRGELRTIERIQLAPRIPSEIQELIDRYC